MKVRIVQKQKKYLETRLKTIEGQVRGVAEMVAEDKYCNDILIQLLAINKSSLCPRLLGVYSQNRLF